MPLILREPQDERWRYLYGSASFTSNHYDAAPLQRWPTYVPVGDLLVGVRHAEHQAIIKGFAHKL